MTGHSEQDDRPRQVLVGVSGGIAAYKSAELVRRLRDRGADVRVAMTAGAQAFITPLTLQAVSGHRVHTELLDEAAEAGMGHIELARWADDVVVAPATADLIARAATGHAGDLLTTVLLATEARVWMAPAMNRVMWDHPAVQSNTACLIERGIRMLGPATGGQACGETGPGRMQEPDDIAEAVMAAGESGPLAGRSFVVTAGPTHEPLDPVRFIGNRSSGRMGFAVASALADAGASVTLVSGPVHQPTPASARGRIQRVDVLTAEQMREAVFAALPADGFVGVAAVADYRPAEVADDKIKKSREPRSVELVLNPDILAEVAASEPRPFTVGFAAETRDLEEQARSKLTRKRLDLIAANPVGAQQGFDRPDNSLLVLSSDQQWTLANTEKTNLARQLVDIIIDRMDMAMRENSGGEGQ